MLIETATGPIPVDQLGATLMHEHIIMAFAGWESDTSARIRSQEELVEQAVARIEELKAAGFASLLDPCPNDLGRDVELYAEVSRRTGFNIIFATGIYNEHYAGAYWRFKLSFDPGGLDYLIAMYMRELTEGVGPHKRKPGVIKLAIGPDPDCVFENQLITAAVTASKATGTPILTHTDGVGGDILLDKLKAQGIPAHRIIIGHSCGSPDQAYHRRIVDGGSYIGFDRFGLDMIQSDDVRTESLYSLLQDGYAEHLLVSHDCAFCQRGQVVPDDGLHDDALFFTREVAPRLRERGISQAMIDSLFIDNPRRFFSDMAPIRKDGTAG